MALASPSAPRRRWLLAGDGKSALEAAVAIPALLMPLLLRLNALAKNFLAVDVLQGVRGLLRGEGVVGSCSRRARFEHAHARNPLPTEKELAVISLGV